MIASDVMTRAVVSVPPNASIIEALRLMLEQRISGLPVVDEVGRLAGILTEGDLLRRSEIGTERQRPSWLEFLRGASAQADDYVHSHGRVVEELMTSDVVTAGETTPLADIVQLMEQKHVKRIPIVTDDRLVGIVSRADLLRALASELTARAAPASDDATIRRDLEAELSSQPWCRGNRVSTIVAGGEVYLEGIVFDERDREAIRVAAQNVPGVKAVRDHIQYVDPNLAMSHGV